MAGRNLFTRSRIVNVFNAVFAEHQSPIGLWFLRKFRDDRFINARRFVKFAGKAQPVRPREQRQFFFIILLWNRLLRSAVFADCDLAVSRNV